MAYLLGYADITRRASTNVVPRIARSHPLAPKLIAAFYPAAYPGGTMTNLAIPGFLDLTSRRNSTSYNGNTPEGPGFNGTTSGGQINTSGLPASFVSLAPSVISLFVRGQWGTINTGSNIPAQIFGFYINTTNFIQCALMASPNSGGSVDNVVGAGYPANATAEINAPGTTVPVVGSMVSIGATFVASSLPSLYVSGVKQALQFSPPVMAATVGSFWNTNGQFTLQEYQSSTRNGEMIVTVAYAWIGRALGDAEHQYLDANPYSLLRWPIDMVYELESPASTSPAAPVPSNRSLIMSPLTVGLDGPAALGLGAAAAAERWLRRRKVQMRRLRGE